MPRQVRRPKHGDDYQIGRALVQFRRRKKRGKGISLVMVVNAPADCGAVKLLKKSSEKSSASVPVLPKRR